jgi:hypothetical protein
MKTEEVDDSHASRFANSPRQSGDGDRTPKTLGKQEGFVATLTYIRGKCDSDCIRPTIRLDGSKGQLRGLQ